MKQQGREQADLARQETKRRSRGVGLKQIGDITKLDGSKIAPVDVVIGGSPCQNLSIAGDRKGLNGSESSLFLHQVRFVKEMREATNGRFPRFMVWENVKGAFSSNQGNDFKTVLEEIVKIKDANATIPRPKNGKWNKSGCIVGDDFSIAWRLHDAQYWGVPQRRERIALVADFGGFAAPEILFKSEGMPGDFAAGRAQRKGVAGGTESSPDSPIWCLQGNGIDRADTAECNGRGWRKDVSYTLNTVDRPAVCAGFKHKAGAKANSIGFTPELSPTLSAGQESAVYDARGNGDGKISPTLTGDHQNRVTDYTALCIGNGQLNSISMAEQANTLNTMHDQQMVYIPEKAHTLKAKANLDCREDSETYVVHNIVRRLTPLERERLQGLPDGWTDIGDWVDSKGKMHKAADSPRYKAIGNGIALPFWQWMLERLCNQFNYMPTLGSLFDGIGSFPLIWERINGKGHTLWASEIEEFPIAVTKKRFGE